MSQFLIFTLYGPLAAWGESAVGEYRPSAAVPSRSALLGLLAACLGYTREDEAAHLTLSQSIGLGTLVVRPGIILRDYHTIQVPSSRKGFRPATRHQELEEPGLNTILSSREYQQDALYLVGLWSTASAPTGIRLEQLQKALESPVFFPSLGRRACPLALPSHPRLEDSPTLVDALRSRLAWHKAHTPLLAPLFPRPASRQETARLLLAWEAPVEGVQIGVNPVRTVERLDAVVNRHQFHFAPRLELQGQLEVVP